MKKCIICNKNKASAEDYLCKACRKTVNKEIDNVSEKENQIQIAISKIPKNILPPFYESKCSGCDTIILHTHAGAYSKCSTCISKGVTID